MLVATRRIRRDVASPRWRTYVDVGEAPFVGRDFFETSVYEDVVVNLQKKR